MAAPSRWLPVVRLGLLLRATQWTWWPGFVVLPASRFKHIWEAETETEAIYKGSPLLTMSNKLRGSAIGEYTWKVLKELYPEAKLEKPERGLDCNGKTRCQGAEPYDLLLNGQRVEVKSSLLLWDRSNHRWKVTLSDIKVTSRKGETAGACDRLFIWLRAPSMLFLYEHDMSLGMSCSGRGTAVHGHQVQLYGSTKAEDWAAAMSQILGKLDSASSGCRLLAARPLAELMTLFEEPDHLRIEKVAYRDLPLFYATNRGARLEQLAYEVAQLLRPAAAFADKSTGRPTQSCDWFEGGSEVECKSSKLSWLASSGTFGFRM